MKKQMHRAVAVAAVAAAGLTGALSSVPAATAATDATPAVAQQSLTKFGHEAWAYGTKVLLNGVEAKTLKTAQAKQQCTRKAGSTVDASSLPDAITQVLPQELKDLVHLDLMSTQTQTYKSGGVNGVSAVSTIGDVAIDGIKATQGVVPTITIQGLQSTANSYFDKSAANGKGAFGNSQAFTFKGIHIDYGGTVVDGTPLASLLDIVNQVTDQVSTQIVTPLIDLLSSVTNGIEIPGLGIISLGSASGKHNATSATSKAYALTIDLFGSDDTPGTKVVLGGAKTRLSNGITSGVFRSNVMGLDLNAGDGILHLGGIQNKGIPCEGTHGKTYTKSIAALPNIPIVSDVLSTIINMSAIKYTYMGQRLSRGRALGVVTSQLGQVDIPMLGLTIKGLTQKVKIISNSRREPVQRRTTVHVGDILLDGTSVLAQVKPLLKKGFDLTSAATGQTSHLKFLNAITGLDNRNGTGITGLKLGFGDLPVIADFGWTSLHYVRERIS